MNKFFDDKAEPGKRTEIPGVGRWKVSIRFLGQSIS